MKSFLEQLLTSPDNVRRFQQERAILEVTELIEQAMQESGVGRSELAKLLGRSKAWVTQLLDGEGNKTIRTVADALAVLGRELRASAPPISLDGQCEQVSVGSYKPQWNPLLKDWQPDVRLPHGMTNWAV